MTLRRVAVIGLVAYTAVVLVLTLGRPAAVLSHDVRSRGAEAASDVPVPPQVRDRVSVPGEHPMSEPAQRTDAGINLLLLAPFGVLLALATRRWPIVLAAPLALSVVIEVLQATVFTYRFAQPSDVVLNTAGAWLASGAVVAARSSLVRRAILRV